MQIIVIQLTVQIWTFKSWFLVLKKASLIQWLLMVIMGKVLISLIEEDSLSDNISPCEPFSCVHGVIVNWSFLYSNSIIVISATRQREGHISKKTQWIINLLSLCGSCIMSLPENPVFERSTALVTTPRSFVCPDLLRGLNTIMFHTKVTKWSPHAISPAQKRS